MPSGPSPASTRALPGRHRHHRLQRHDIGAADVDDDRLASLVQILNQHRLGLEDVEKDILGQAYEYLLRKFAEGQGSSAGEFLTPPEVALLMAMILNPQPGQSVYDSNCGTAGLLIKAHLRLIDKFGVKGNGSKKLPPKVAPLKLFGQEINPSTFAMARMNAFIHDMEAEIALGDTMTNPRFTQREGSLRRFDLVTANPMWNQKFAASLYENDTWGRFTRGIPPTSSADWGWIQHMHASLAVGASSAVNGRACRRRRAVGGDWPAALANVQAATLRENCRPEIASSSEANEEGNSEPPNHDRKGEGSHDRGISHQANSVSRRGRGSGMYGQYDKAKKGK